MTWTLSALEREFEIEIPHPRVEAIVAIAENGIIGRDDGLPWRLKKDLQRFKKITMGHAMLMGRKTYDSIGRPLPGRTTWILSRNRSLSVEGCRVTDSFSEALGGLQDDQKLFIVGGAQVFEQCIHYCSTIHRTVVLGNVEGDTFLSPFDLRAYTCEEESFVPADEENDWPTRYERWRFRSPGSGL